jgi:hypothetical protein
VTTLNTQNLPTEPKKRYNDTMVAYKQDNVLVAKDPPREKRASSSNGGKASASDHDGQHLPREGPHALSSMCQRGGGPKKPMAANTSTRDSTDGQASAGEEAKTPCGKASAGGTTKTHSAAKHLPERGQR